MAVPECRLWGCMDNGLRDATEPWLDMSLERVLTHGPSCVPGLARALV